MGSLETDRRSLGSRTATLLLAAHLSVGCAAPNSSIHTSGSSAGALRDNTGSTTVEAAMTRARTPAGRSISWREHLVDSEDVNGGLAIRGADGLKLADLDRDGRLDIVSVHEDSDHARIAFGEDSPDRWTHVTLATGSLVDAVEDVAVGDLNGDGWLDLMFACERGHIIYFENPGETARVAPWRHSIPRGVRGRGSWLRVFIADVDNDGQPEVLAANKGAVDVVDPSSGEPIDGPTSMFRITGDPLDPDSWTETVLARVGIPNTAMPVDIDRDGDVDVLTSARRSYRAFILENVGKDASRDIRFELHEIAIRSGQQQPANWTAATSAFHSAFADLDRDGRVDLIVGVIEVTNGAPDLSFGWLQQPENLDQAWTFHRIGDLDPDWITGFALGDIDGDQDLDVIAGSYSGINILVGGYTGASRDFDDPVVTAADSVGRIAWFANPGDSTQAWDRHDISRRVRGMYDEFIPHDMDADGDIDWIGTRGNSGRLDGVFWLEQVRTDEPHQAFVPGRAAESRALPLPPEDWIESYDRRSTTVAPNEIEGE